MTLDPLFARLFQSNSKRWHFEIPYNRRDDVIGLIRPSAHSNRNYVDRTHTGRSRSPRDQTAPGSLRREPINRNAACAENFDGSRHAALQRIAASDLRQKVLFREESFWSPAFHCSSTVHCPLNAHRLVAVHVRGRGRWRQAVIPFDFQDERTTLVRVYIPPTKTRVGVSALVAGEAFVVRTFQRHFRFCIAFFDPAFKRSRPKLFSGVTNAYNTDGQFSACVCGVVRWRNTTRKTACRLS